MLRHAPAETDESSSRLFGRRLAVERSLWCISDGKWVDEVEIGTRNSERSCSRLPERSTGQVTQQGDGCTAFPQAPRCFKTSPSHVHHRNASSKATPDDSRASDPTCDAIRRNEDVQTLLIDRQRMQDAPPNRLKKIMQAPHQPPRQQWRR